MTIRCPQLAPLDILEVSGTPLEIAHRLGKIRRSQIRRRVFYWEKEISRWYEGKIKRLREMEQIFFHYARRQALPFLNEIEAMAEGAGVPFPKLFRLNLTELPTFADKCTDLILPFRDKNGKPAILLAHNEDWNPARNDVFLLKANLGEVRYLTLAYDGYLPGLSAGLNSHGLAHSVNYLHPRDKRLGLPRIFLARRLLTANSFGEVFDFIQGITRAFGQSIHLAQGNQYLNLELSARRMALRRPRLPTAHTNHYLARKFAKMEAPAGPSSRHRLGIATSLLEEKWRNFLPPYSKARDLAKAILSDRSGLPHAIWRTPQPPAETSATLACVLLRTDLPAWEVYRGPPNQVRPIRGGI